MFTSFHCWFTISCIICCSVPSFPSSNTVEIFSRKSAKFINQSGTNNKNQLNLSQSISSKIRNKTMTINNSESENCKQPLSIFPDLSSQAKNPAITLFIKNLHQPLLSTIFAFNRQYFPVFPCTDYSIQHSRVIATPTNISMNPFNSMYHWIHNNLIFSRFELSAPSKSIFTKKISKNHEIFFVRVKIYAYKKQYTQNFRFYSYH